MINGIHREVRGRSHAGIGVVSILLVLIVVCMTVLGILSLVSARSGRAPSERQIASAAAYYAAEARMERALAELDARLARGEAAEAGGDVVLTSGEVISLSAADGGYILRTEAGDGSAIVAEISVPGTDGARYALTSLRRVWPEEWV